MDSIFWMGIALGAILGLIASVLGNLLTDPLREQINRTRKIWLARKQEQEAKTYRRVVDLRAGSPVATLLRQHKRDVIVESRLVTISGLNVAAFMYFMFAILPETNSSVGEALRKLEALVPIPLLSLPASLVFVSLLLFVITPSAMGIRSDTSKIMRFEEYDKLVRRRWGESVVDDWLRK